MVSVPTERESTVLGTSNFVAADIKGVVSLRSGGDRLVLFG